MKLIAIIEDIKGHQQSSVLDVKSIVRISSYAWSMTESDRCSCNQFFHIQK